MKTKYQGWSERPGLKESEAGTQRKEVAAEANAQDEEEQGGPWKEGEGGVWGLKCEWEGKEEERKPAGCPVNAREGHAGVDFTCIHLLCEPGLSPKLLCASVPSPVKWGDVDIELTGVVHIDCS